MTAGPAPRFLDRATPPHIATLISVSGLGALNVSIFLPSLDRMAADLGTDYAVMQLAVSGYLATTAVLQILLGAAADRFGRRPVMLGALAVFVAATLGILWTTTAWTFLVLRMVQGVAVAGIVLSRAVVRDMVGQAEAASRIGYVTMGMALVPMLGPVAGGALDEGFGWRASFGLLAGLGLATLALVALDQGETARAGGQGLRLQLRQWPALLGSRAFWGYTLCAAFASGAFFALLGGASFVAGTVFGLSPVWTGLALGTPAVGYVLGNFLSGRLSARIGTDRMAAAGCAIATFGMTASLLVTLAGWPSPWVFFGFCAALGLGNGLTLPNALAGAVSVRPDLAGAASGLSGAIMTAGGAILAALAGTLLTGSAGLWLLQALMAAVSALAGAALLLVRR
ncbi:MFS transporter [Rubellimicrobium sp. CFH 75288]|uniref:MFS transporter n=1 Tax=Rubellimicrobium sp. CFH 75288 TaxID=2697034 RepID=UPI00141326DE|nr:MFS transporter [Rubellimicrobium sp. CFH 75288]NAZ35896.1 MFS transporter [Rubellimicrobium sp. CFH 75288]